MKKDDDIKKEWIKNGVKKLRLFGFTNVTEENILTDEVYRLYFERILRSNPEAGMDEKINKLFDGLKNRK